jgi:hypothetical protein
MARWQSGWGILLQVGHFLVRRCQLPARNVLPFRLRAALAQRSSRAGLRPRTQSSPFLLRRATRLAGINILNRNRSNRAPVLS